MVAAARRAGCALWLCERASPAAFARRPRPRCAGSAEIVFVWAAPDSRSIVVDVRAASSPRCQWLPPTSSSPRPLTWLMGLWALPQGLRLPPLDMMALWVTESTMQKGSPVWCLAPRRRSTRAERPLSTTEPPSSNPWAQAHRREVLTRYLREFPDMLRELMPAMTEGHVKIKGHVGSEGIAGPRSFVDPESAPVLEGRDL